MIFNPKKGGSFFDILTPPHPPHPPLQKVGFKWGGVWGGVDQKLIGGCVYWTK